MQIVIKSKNSWLLPAVMSGGLIILVSWGVRTSFDQLSKMFLFCQNFMMFYLAENPALLILLMTVIIFLLIGLFRAATFIVKEAQRINSIKAYLKVLCVEDSYGICLINAPDPMAFTLGWFSPKIIYTSALAKILSEDELISVLSHEAAHQSRRDPLRRLLTRAMSELLFFLPVIKDLTDNLASHQEAQADKIAIKQHGQEYLMSGMKKLLTRQLNEELGDTVCPMISTHDRLKSLQSGSARYRFTFSLQRLIISLAFLFLVVSVLFIGQKVEAAQPNIENNVCQSIVSKKTGVEVGGYLMSVQNIQWNEMIATTFVVTNN